MSYYQQSTASAHQTELIVMSIQSAAAYEPQPSNIALLNYDSD